MIGPLVETIGIRIVVGRHLGGDARQHRVVLRDLILRRCFRARQNRFDFRDQPVHRIEQRHAAAGLRNVDRGIDGIELRIQNGADARIVAAFAHLPGDLADDPRRAPRLRGGFGIVTCEIRGDTGSGAPHRLPDGVAEMRGWHCCGRRLGRDDSLDPRHRVEHHRGVGVAVAAGVFDEKPAAPRGLHQRVVHARIIRLAQRGEPPGRLR